MRQTRLSKTRLSRLAVCTWLTLGGVEQARATTTEPVPPVIQPLPSAEETGHRRLLDLEVHPLFSFPDPFGVCVEAFPMRQGLSIRGCGAVSYQLFGTLEVGAAYRFPIYTGPILAMGLGPGAGAHWLYDTLSGPLIGWSTDAFASFEAVWWGDMVGFQAQVKAGAMWLHDRAPDKSSLERWSPIVDLTLGVAFRTPS